MHGRFLKHYREREIGGMKFSIGISKHNTTANQYSKKLTACELAISRRSLRRHERHGIYQANNICCARHHNKRSPSMK